MLQDDLEEYSLVMSPQMTSAELAETEAAAKKALMVGGSVVIWQLISLVVLGKALHTMWILINTLQFFVYISYW